MWTMIIVDINFQRRKTQNLECGFCFRDSICLDIFFSRSAWICTGWFVNNGPPKYKSVKIQFCCVHKSKISAHGWRAWKNWFFILLTFLAGVTFWSIIFEKNDQKITRAKKNLRPKNHFCHTFLPHKNFWNPCFIFKLFCQRFVVAVSYHF